MSLRKPFRAIPIREGRTHRHKRAVANRRSFWSRLAKLGLAAAVLGSAIGYLTSLDETGTTRGSAILSKLNTERSSGSDNVYFRYCDEARAAGKAPIYRGEPGYRPSLDADNDGIACEPYP